MKKYLFILFLALTSCTQKSINLKTKKQSGTVEKVYLTPVTHHFISIDQAKSIAKLKSIFTKVSGIGDGKNTAGTLAIANSQAQKISSVQTISSDENDSAEVYIINYADSGFVIISGDDRMIPILAYSKSGSINLSDTLIKPSGIQDWLKGIKTKIRDFRQKNLAADSLVKNSWKEYRQYSEITLSGTTPNLVPGGGDTTSPNPSLPDCSSNGLVVSEMTSDVGQLLSTTWNQEDGYNDLLVNIGCTNSFDGMPPTGCVATSTAQIMKFYQWPSSYNWASMPDTYGTAATQQLMKDIGQAVKMQYACSGSSAYSSDDANALVSVFNYASAT